MRRIVLLTCLGLGLLAAASSAATTPSPADSIDSIDWRKAPEYRIVPGDVLSLNFGPQQDQRVDMRETTVRPDGRITVFPIGDVVAAGRTPVELQSDLIGLLAAELRQPRVTVEVKSMAGNRVHVLGRVRKPGSMPVGPLPTLLQAITEAGGFEDDAARNSVLIMHRVGLGTVNVARVRVDRLLRGGGDVPLSRFDIVYVPRSAIGNLDVFVDQFFTRTLAVPNTAIIGWELFNLEKVFQFRTVAVR